MSRAAMRIPWAGICRSFVRPYCLGVILITMAVKL